MLRHNTGFEPEFPSTLPDMLRLTQIKQSSPKPNFR